MECARPSAGFADRAVNRRDGLRSQQVQTPNKIPRKTPKEGTVFSLPSGNNNRGSNGLGVKIAELACQLADLGNSTELLTLIFSYLSTLLSTSHDGYEF